MLKSKSLSSFRILILCIIYFGVYLFVYQDFLSTIILASFGTTGFIISLAIANLFLLVIFFFVCWKYYAQSFDIFFRNSFSNIKSVCLGIIALFISEALVSNLIIVLCPNVVSDNQISNEIVLSLSPACFIWISFLVGPMIEETIFRGCIFHSLRNKHSFLLSALLSSSIFGLMHIISSLLHGNWMNCVYFLIYAVSGFILCIPYEETDTVASSIFVHMAVNCISVVILWMI